MRGKPGIQGRGSGAGGRSRGPHLVFLHKSCGIACILGAESTMTESAGCKVANVTKVSRVWDQLVFRVRLSGRVNLRRSTGAVLGAAILLSGCSFASESLWPSLTGDEPSGRAPESVSISPSRAELNTQQTFGAPPRLTAAPGPAMALAPAAATGRPTGTLVGQKVGQLCGQLQRLNGRIAGQTGQCQQLRRSPPGTPQR